MAQYISSPWDIYASQDPQSVEAMLAANSSSVSPPNPPVLKPITQPVVVRPPVRPPIQLPAPVVQQAMPVPQMSGLMSRNEAANEATNKTGQTSSTYLQPGEYEQLANTIRSTPEYQQDLQNQEMNKRLFMGELTRRPGIDLATPLANLSDFVQTGKLGNRQPAETSKDYLNRIREWAKQVQDDQRDLYNSLRSGVAGLKSGATTQQYLDLLRQNAISSAIDPAQKAKGGNPNRDAQALFRAYQQDITPAKQSLQAAQNALATIDVNNPTSYNAALNFMARASGEKGPLSEGDIQRFSGNPSLNAKLSRIWEKLRTGNPLSVDKHDLQELAHGYLNFQASLLKDRTNYFVNQVAPYSFGVSPAQARKALSPTEGFLPKEAPKAPPPDIDKMISELLKAKK